MTSFYVWRIKMNFKRTAVMSLSLIASSLSFADNAQVSGFTPEQVKQLDVVIHNYLVKNPEVLIEASQALQNKQQQQMQQEANSFIQKNAKELLTENLTIAGSKAPNVTVVEFFDYQCGHCKKMSPVVSELLSKNPNLKVVYREFPIFGKTSQLASQAAIAAAMQGKYLEMQKQLFEAKKIDDASILEAAKKVGLNIPKFQADMKSKEVADNIAHNRKLADSMKLFGTPVFIVLATPNGEFNPKVQAAMIPGSTTPENFQKLITQAAEAK